MEFVFTPTFTDASNYFNSATDIIMDVEVSVANITLPICKYTNRICACLLSTTVNKGWSEGDGFNKLGYNNQFVNQNITNANYPSFNDFNRTEVATAVKENIQLIWGFYMVFSEQNQVIYHY